MKRIVMLLAVTAISVLALAAPAFAQGQSERGPEHANSICSFSGLNEPEEVGSPDPAIGGLVQSYGQLVRQGLKPFVPSPGEACNGHLNPYDYPYT